MLVLYNRSFIASDVLLSRSRSCDVTAPPYLFPIIYNNVVSEHKRLFVGRAVKNVVDIKNDSYVAGPAPCLKTRSFRCRVDIVTAGR